MFLQETHREHDDGVAAKKKSIFVLAYTFEVHRIGQDLRVSRLILFSHFFCLSSS